MRRSMISLTLLVALVVTLALPVETAARERSVSTNASADEQISRAERQAEKRTARREARKVRRQALRGITGKSAGGGLCEMSDEQLIALFTDMNAAYADAGIGVQIAEFECFTIGNGRPPVRILQNPFRWVSFDPRRAAQGDDITFIVDDSQALHAPASLGAWPSAEVAAGQTTWFGDSCMEKVDVFQRASTGNDDTLFDEGLFSQFCTLPGGDLPGFPSTTLGVPAGVFAADIIHAGWYPAGCFGPFTLAFSVTFTFTGTDVNNDQYADTALNEVYYNDAFVWDTTGGNVDVETVALHESGHSLGVGHFGPPPRAIMNPVYAGRRVNLRPIDHAGMCTVWAQWPR